MFPYKVVEERFPTRSLPLSPSTGMLQHPNVIYDELDLSHDIDEPDTFPHYSMQNSSTKLIYFVNPDLVLPVSHHSVHIIPANLLPAFLLFPMSLSYATIVKGTRGSHHQVHEGYCVSTTRDSCMGPEGAEVTNILLEINCC